MRAYRVYIHIEFVTVTVTVCVCETTESERVSERKSTKREHFFI